MKPWQVAKWGAQVVKHIKLSAEVLKLPSEAHQCIAALGPEAPEEVRKEQTRVKNILRSLGGRLIGIGEALQDNKATLATLEVKAGGLINECEIALETLPGSCLSEGIEELRRERRKMIENAGQ